METVADKCAACGQRIADRVLKAPNGANRLKFNAYQARYRREVRAGLRTPKARGE